MNNFEHHGNKGFTLIEVMVVIAIISALSSIATPNYLKYLDNAREAACQVNRRSIEASESEHFTDHNAPNLDTANQYTCPSGGEYVWLVSDPDDPDYPKVACSLHYAGESETPAQALDNLKSTVKDLNLSKKLEKNLIKRLNRANTRLERGKTKKTVKALETFIRQVNRRAGKKIKEEDAGAIVSRAQEIIGSL